MSLLIIGKESRLREEIDFFLTSQNINCVCKTPLKFDVKRYSTSRVSAKYPLIVIIYEFPTFRNLQMIEQLKESTSSSIILISSDSSLRFKDKIKQLGINEVIFKPFAPKELIKLVNHKLLNSKLA